MEPVASENNLQKMTMEDTHVSTHEFYSRPKLSRQVVLQSSDFENDQQPIQNEDEQLSHFENYEQPVNAVIRKLSAQEKREGQPSEQDGKSLPQESHCQQPGMPDDGQSCDQPMKMEEKQPLAHDSYQQLENPEHEESSATPENIASSSVIVDELRPEWDPRSIYRIVSSYFDLQNDLHPCESEVSETATIIYTSSKMKVSTMRGPRCLKCIDGCPGLDLHYFRKVCKNCRCPQEDHDLPASEDADFRPISLLFDSTMTSRDGKADWMARLEKLSIKDPGGLAQMCSPQNDVVISRLISENMRSQKYISMLPEDKQEFAAQLRRRQLQRQLPLHDLDPRFCTSLGEKEAAKYEKFMEKRRKKAAGIGQVGEVSCSGTVKCHQCKKVIESGSAGVIAARLPGECWHPGCFSCSTCRQLLVDNIYFSREGSVYCGRHYADQLYPRCTACDELIFAREYTQAEGRSWHVHHFCCWSCDTPLAGQRYIAKDDNPYCMMCFEKLYSKVCSTCQRPITSDHPGVTHNSYHWHACPHCFSCHACARALMNQPFILRDGRLYCSSECQYRLNGCSHTASIARQYAT